MRSMGEGYALVILTFWRGDTLNVPLHRLRRSPSPFRGGITPQYPPPCRGGINTGCCASRVFGHTDRRDRPQPTLRRRESWWAETGLKALPASLNPARGFAYRCRASGPSCSGSVAPPMRGRRRGRRVRLRYRRRIRSRQSLRRFDSFPASSC